MNLEGMETPEAVTPPRQPSRGDSALHSNDVEHHHFPQQIQDVQRLEHKVQELQDNMANQCTRQLLAHDTLEQIQKQTNELILSQKTLDQLDERFSSAMDSHHNNTNNVDQIKQIVLQEMGDVNHDQGGLQELKPEVAESFHQKQFKVHARLANNVNLEGQSHAKSVSETLNTKILQSQKLKSNTKLCAGAHRISGECQVCAHWINLGCRKFNAVKGYTDTTRCHTTAATLRT